MKKARRTVTVILLALVLVLPLSILTACDNGENEDEAETVDGYYTENTVRYYIKANDIHVMELPIGFLFEPSQTYFELRPDGTMEIRAIFKENFPAVVKSILQSTDTDLSELDVQGIVDTYVLELMPAFTLKDIPFSLGLLEATLGLRIEGLDFEYKGVKKICDSLAETSRLPSVLDLPEGLGVVYEGKYRIKDLTSEVTGKTFRAVYTGGSAANGEPYMVLTMAENDEGKETLSLHIEFLNITVTGTTL